MGLDNFFKIHRPVVTSVDLMRVRCIVEHTVKLFPVIFILFSVPGSAIEAGYLLD